MGGRYKARSIAVLEQSINTFQSFEYPNKVKLHISQRAAGVHNYCDTHTEMHRGRAVLPGTDSRIQPLWFLPYILPLHLWAPNSVSGSESWKKRQLERHDGNQLEVNKAKASQVSEICWEGRMTFYLSPLRAFQGITDNAYLVFCVSGKLDDEILCNMLVTIWSCCIEYKVGTAMSYLSTRPSGSKPWRDLERGKEQITTG